MKVAQSSHLQHYEYDATNRVLTIEFTNGAIYDYTNVPPDDYERLQRAESPGSFFHNNIKGNYQTRKLYDPRKR